jgi:hypothetical protein
MSKRYLDKVLQSLIEETEINEHGYIVKLPYYDYIGKTMGISRGDYSIGLNDMTDNSIYWKYIKEDVFGLSDLESTGVFISYTKYVQDYIYEHCRV